MADDMERFPELERLLKNLQNGLANFGLDSIQLLLLRVNNKEFNKLARRQSTLLEMAIEEIKKACGNLEYPVNEGQVRFLLWDGISRLARKKLSIANEAENVGQRVVSALRNSREPRLICIPLHGSQAPPQRITDAIRVFELADNIWLMEKAVSARTLIKTLFPLAGYLPKSPIDKIETVAGYFWSESWSPEYQPLVEAPLLVARTSGAFSSKSWRLMTYGIPMLALENIIRFTCYKSPNAMLPSSYLGRMEPFPLPAQFQAEWNKQIGEKLFSELSSQGFMPEWLWPRGSYSARDSSPTPAEAILYYDIKISCGDISPVSAFAENVPLLPPLVILPSLFDSQNTARLLDAGEEMEKQKHSNLTRCKIGYAIKMWTQACRFLREVSWDIGYDENRQYPIIANPDLLILYSAIILETLLSQRYWLSQNPPGLITSSRKRRYARKFTLSIFGPITSS